MTYDFIVVGSGPAGACLASRLAHTSKSPKVLLLEAGIAAEKRNKELLFERWSSFMTYPTINWGYKSVPQKFLNSREVDYSRGKTLGGSTAINICAYTVGPRDDYDRWAEEVGDGAFSWKEAQRKRKNIEDYDTNVDAQLQKYANPKPEDHGHGGPVRVSFPVTWETGLTDQLDAGREFGFGVNPDMNSGDPIGLAHVPSTARKGKRESSASAYLQNVPANLTIITQAQVTKVLFYGKKALGVVANGQEYYATKDVVLSGGAVDTPKLLMLSGVGNNHELAKHKIATVHNLPGVGQNLQDHLFTFMSWRQSDGHDERSAFFSDPEAVRKAQERFAKDGSGPLSIVFGAIGMGFFKADELQDTDVFKKLPSNVQEHIRKDTVPLWEMTTDLPAPFPDANPAHSYLTLAAFCHNPQSVGTIKLASADPKDPPLVDPNFLDHPFDQAVAVVALRNVVNFAQTPKLKKNIIGPFHVPESTSDQDLLAYWRQNGVSTWHPSSTVKMGKKEDQMACVDSDFRVFGLQHLRVVDLSVTTFLPNCHVQSIAYFIGETAAEKMIQEYNLDG